MVAFSQVSWCSRILNRIKIQNKMHAHSKVNTLLLSTFQAAGVTMVGLGAWAIVTSSGLDLFEALLKEPSWLMIATGIVMIVVGVVGCAGALRLHIVCLRVVSTGCHGSVNVVLW